MHGNRLKLALRALAVWLVFSGLWTSLNMVYNPGAPLGAMIVVGLSAMGNAGILAIGVWHLTGRLPWPRPVRPGFLTLHLAASLAFGLLWIVMGLGLSSLRTGENLFRNPGATQLLGWRMLMGIFLYGLIAGTSYTVRTQRRLLDQERLAAEARALAAEVRLQGLRAQLHPHFLFNALHTVSALVNRAPDRAKLALQQLGDLLRYSLDGGAGSDGLVPLEREWSFTRDYLELERLRLGDRLRVRAEIPAGTTAVLVPVFCLQTLVENAVRHGAAPRAEGAEIRVEARLAGRDLRIRVTDDGPGPTPSSNGSGLGLRLLAQQLETLYGAAASLETRAPPGGGFRVELRFPALPDHASGARPDPAAEVVV